MSNNFFDWTVSANRFVRFDTVRSADANDALDLVSAGFDKLPALALAYGGAANYAVATGPADAWTVTLAATYVTALYDGLTVKVKFPAPNATATPTVNLNAKGAIVLKHEGAGAMVANDIVADLVGDLTYVAAGTPYWQFRPSGSASSAAAAASALAAATSAGNALTSENNTAAIYDAFDDRYLGAKAADPTLDNDGNALANGTLYFNTVTGLMRVYSTTLVAWQTTYVPGSSYVLKAGDTLTGVINEAPAVTVASGSGTFTADFLAAASKYITISGTTAVTALGTIAAGAQRIIKFSGILTFTHNATSLIIPGSANITTAANDEAMVTSLGGGNWKVDWYSKADGTALVGGNPAFGSVGTAQVLATSAASGGAVHLTYMSATRAIVAYTEGGGNNPKAALVDQTGAMVGGHTPITLEAVNCNAGGTIDIIQIDATRAIMCWMIAGTSLRAAIITLSGTTLTAGTIVTVSSQTMMTARLALLTSAKVACAFGESSSGTEKAVILGVSGTTITVNTVYTIDGGGGGGDSSTGISVLSATQFVVVWGAANAMKANICTEASNVLTFPASSQTISYLGTANFTAASDCVAMTTTKFASVGGSITQNSGIGRGVIAEIAGTGTSANFKIGPSTPFPSTASGGQRVRKLSANTILRLGSSDTAIPTLCLMSTTVDVDQLKPGAAITVARNASNKVDFVQMDASTLLVAYVDADNSNYPTLRSVALGSVV